MKCLTLFLHRAVAEAFVDALRDDPAVSGFTLTDAEGHSGATAEDPDASPRDRVVGHVPRARIDVVVPAESLAGVLERLRASARSDRSAGTWIVTDVLEFGRL